MATNPFHDLYLTEAISEDDVVQFFSPIIVDHSSIIFEAGNVVIRGLQGTGKTMLLNLLRPELRIAYKRANVNFPVPEKLSKFIGSGINLRKCGILEFAQHLEQGMSEKSIQELVLLFGDFFNYWIILDLLRSIEIFVNTEFTDIAVDVGVSQNTEKLNSFVKLITKEDCWFKFLDDIDDFENLKLKIHNRISDYRRFLNLNDDELPESITLSKTVIGDPILKVVDALKKSNLIDPKTKIFVRIDQYEQLTTLNIAGTTYGQFCQELVHKALAARDGRVSYRIGTRTYGWDERPQIYKTNDVLERKRDFDVHDMDELFRRRENRATWWFPEFANDIFCRRIKKSEYSRTEKALEMSTIFGRSLSSNLRAESYLPNQESRSKVIETALSSLPSQVTEEWKSYIRNWSADNVLTSWLCCAWVRQKIARKRDSLTTAPPTTNVVPWSRQPYWFKERVQQGLIQLASANRQTPMWSGDTDILNLSDGQILLFLFILQHIWDAWLRDQRGTSLDKFQFPIGHPVQSQGVREASNEWRTKQTEGPNAYLRKVFVDRLGQHLYVSLTSDKAMSHPGANGFSVENTELDSNSDVKQFLLEAVSYGDLVAAPHTSKKKGERRTKFYLTPILSPYFRIPSVHTKEPQYVSVSQVRNWMQDSIKIENNQNQINPSNTSHPNQPSLWED